MRRGESEPGSWSKRLRLDGPWLQGEDAQGRAAPSGPGHSNASWKNQLGLVGILALALAARAYFLLAYPFVYNADAVTRLGFYDAVAVRRWLPIPQVLIFLYERSGLPLLGFRWIVAAWSIAALALFHRFLAGLVGRTAALAGLLLLAFATPFTLASTNPYQEPFCFTFLLGGLLLLEGYPEAPSRRRMIAAVGFLGLAGLSRYEAWAVIPFAVARAYWRSGDGSRGLWRRSAQMLRGALLPLLLAFVLPAAWIAGQAARSIEETRGGVDTMEYLSIGRAPTSQPDDGGGATALIYARQFSRDLVGVLHPRGHLARLLPWHCVALGLLGLATLPFLPSERRRRLAFYAVLAIPVLAVISRAGMFFPLAPRVFLSVIIFWMPLFCLAVELIGDGMRRVLGRFGAIAAVCVALVIGGGAGVRGFQWSIAMVEDAAADPTLGQPKRVVEAISKEMLEANETNAPVYLLAPRDREYLAYRIYFHPQRSDLVWLPPDRVLAPPDSLEGSFYFIYDAALSPPDWIPAGARELSTGESGWRVLVVGRSHREPPPDAPGPTSA